MAAARRPLGGLSSAWWLQLLLAVVALFYLLFTAGAIWAGRLFEYVGSDYLAFRASAQIAVRHGFAQVYDLALQAQVQREIHDASVPTPLSETYAPIPTPYLPAFILPFTLLLLLPPVPGFALWAVLNLVVLGFYLRRLAKAAGISAGVRVLAMAMLSAPVFANWFFGQISFWLLICLGEFMLASIRGAEPGTSGRPPRAAGGGLASFLRGKDFRAGLWLGGLLIKPQILILLLPGLLLRRRWATLAGFVTAALVVAGLSFLLAGPAGLADLVNLVFRYSEGLPTNHPEVMINWRALLVNSEALLSSPVAWGLAIAGMALTAVAGLVLWLRPVAAWPDHFAVACLGTYAATCAVTWHAHVNLAVALLAPLVLLYGRPGHSRALWDVWLLVPTLIFPLALFTLPGIAHNLVGLGLFALNLYLVGWAVWKLRPWQPAPATAPLAAPAAGREAGEDGRV